MEAGRGSERGNGSANRKGTKTKSTKRSVRMASGKGGEYEKDNRRGNGKRNETGTEYGRLRRVKAGSEVEIGREVVSEIEVVREVDLDKYICQYSTRNIVIFL